ncbi:MAG: glucose-6-phosphate dehydrogenase [Chloroflexi bacterium]|nr:glucose-6-phosphate dehydrogenase [Chloroflexota bacterium]
MSDSTPTTIVIFGASGDLTRRKLVPALFNLYRKNRLPDNYNIVGFSRSDLGTAVFRQRMRAGIDEFVKEPFTEAEWQAFAVHLHYVAGGFVDAADYAQLKTALGEIEVEKANRLYYLATPPRFFAEIVSQLGAAGMVQEGDGETAASTGSEQAIFRRVVIEKPFGYDLTSAQALNRAIHTDLTERQIYRIDHYLAKETVQNILFFRFGNIMFEPLWNRNYIDHVQITVAESVDVGHRAGYYDQAGVLRDMFQNHLMQLLALVSMEPPASFSADAVRNEKAKALSSIRPMTPDEIAAHTVRAQYKGYLDAPGVPPNSQTPTYAALQLHIDNWRWRGVPFYLRSGKALAQKATEVLIQFKQPPHMMFSLPPEQGLRSNYLALCIQPHEGIHQRFEAKAPDTAAEMRSVNMDFHYDEAFGECAIPEAYERLLLNALEGDATLFTRSDGIEAAWRTIDPILQAWETAPSALLRTGVTPMATYEPGSWGPGEADELLGRNGRRWRYSCAEHD